MDALRIVFTTCDLDEQQRLSGVCRYFRKSVDFAAMARKQTVRSVVKHGSRRLLLYVANRFGASSADWGIAVHRAFLAGHDDLAIWMIPKAKFSPAFMVEHSAKFGIIAEFDYAMTFPESGCYHTMWAGLNPNIPAKKSTHSESFVAAYRGGEIAPSDIYSLLGAVCGGRAVDIGDYSPIPGAFLVEVCGNGRLDMVDAVFRYTAKNAFTENGYLSSIVMGTYLGGNRRTTEATLSAIYPSLSSARRDLLRKYATDLRSKWLAEFARKQCELQSARDALRQCPAITSSGKVCSRVSCKVHSSSVVIHIWISKTDKTVTSASSAFECVLLAENRLILAAVPASGDSFIVVETQLLRVLLVSKVKLLETAAKHARKITQGPITLIRMQDSACIDIYRL